MTSFSFVPAALMEVEPTQLVLFVQSFGIPVSSMSRLLAALDQAVVSDQAAMSQAVVDPSYMADLVDIQHKRGAVGGMGFYKMLTQGKEVIKSDGQFCVLVPDLFKNTFCYIGPIVLAPIFL